MPSCFNANAWKTRAAARLVKRRRRPDSVGRYLREIVLIEEIERVVDWCYDRGVSVFFDDTPNGVCEGNEIHLNKRYSVESSLHVLLHECGHFLLNKSRRSDRFRHGYVEDDPRRKRSSVHRVDILDEELEAWHRGLRIAVRLNLRLDLDEYNRTRARYIKSYSRWVSPRRKRSWLKTKARK